MHKSIWLRFRDYSKPLKSLLFLKELMKETGF